MLTTLLAQSFKYLPKAKIKCKKSAREKKCFSNSTFTWYYLHFLTLLEKQKDIYMLYFGLDIIIFTYLTCLWLFIYGFNCNYICCIMIKKNVFGGFFFFQRVLSLGYPPLKYLQSFPEHLRKKLHCKGESYQFSG